MVGPETLMDITELIEAEDKLRKRFLAEARVTDPEKGYISLPSVNQRVNSEMQRWVVDLIVHHFAQSGINLDVVLEIPNSGTPLAAVVADRLNIDLIRGRKGKDIPGSWRSPLTVEVPSFTTGVLSTITFSGIREGETPLVIDDVIATGATSEALAKELAARGNRAFFASYFAKLWEGNGARQGQDGVRILRGMGIEPFYAIGVADIVPQNGEWGLQLSPPHYSGTGNGSA